MAPLDYSRLVAEHRNRIFTFAFYTLKHREDAEDVTQEVLVRMWRHRRKLDPARIGAWLTRVTRNACFDVARRRKVRRAVHPSDPEPQLERAACGQPTPDQTAAGAELRVRIERALRDLDDPYRSIVVMREIQHLSYREIAETLDRPLNTIKVYLHRARRMLRHALAEEEAHARAS